MATGYAPERMHVSARQGTLPWLQKPYTLTELAAAVRTALDTNRSDPWHNG
jgi:FixJ family two-component response regulator